MGRARVAAFAAVVPAVALATWLASPTARTYRILPGRGRITVRVRSEGQIHPTSGLLLEAKDYRGKIVFDPKSPGATRVELHVPVRSLEPVAPRMTTEEHDYVLEWLRSSWVLDEARAAEIAFVGSGAKWG